jgi:acyl carrier protein phosphodiesterase
LNFLAHAYLSFDVPHLIVGNFLADFLRPAETRGLPPPILAGVALHRKIDTFTDSHPAFKAGTARMRPYHGKYSPVVVDMFYDYLLAKNWEQFCEKPLPEFSQGVYRVLEAHLAVMPERIQERAPRMISADWLTSYGADEGMRYAFYRMEMRASRPEGFNNAFEHLLEHWDDFQQDFQMFFPEMAAHAKKAILDAFHNS